MRTGCAPEYESYMNDGKFRQRLRESYPPLRLALGGDDSLVVRQGSEVLFEISAAIGGMRIQGPHVDAHRKNLEESLELIWQLLRGDARSVEEFRDGTLAARWIEVREGDAFVQIDLAAHLSPFDEAEWTPRPGEVWRIRRYGYALSYSELKNEHVEQTFFDVAGSEPQGANPAAFNLLATALGPAIDGFRWTNGPDSRSMLQVPKAWRRFQEDGDGFVDFESPTDSCFLRIVTYYAAPSQPSNPTRTKSFESSTQSYEFVEANGWNCDRYTLAFHGDDKDMLAVLEAYWPEAEQEPVEFRESIRRTAPLIRMTPVEWSMSPD